ncbi:MAG: sugar phosphate nucleotidyltransferase [Patescibacteria group bacterium]|nr:sugar phosphate nucleotidyltransferase [Patescibacteria group bacterium]
MIIGIILAAGKGTRLKSKKTNKVTLPFLNKPLVLYAVDLMEKIAKKTIVVIGAFHQSVKEALKNKKVIYAYQKKRLGTGHAVKVALDKIDSLKLKPNLILVGYGDHTMFYRKQDIEKLINEHLRNKAAMSLITTKSNENEKLHWGYIIRDKNNNVVDSVEYKDASDDIKRKINELNAGFYCFDFEFLKNNIKKIPKSLVSGEYYINSLVNIASKNNLKILGIEVPFSSVGIGVNTKEEFEESQKIYLSLKK